MPERTWLFAGRALYPWMRYLGAVAVWDCRKSFKAWGAKLAVLKAWGKAASKVVAR